MKKLMVLLVSIMAVALFTGNSFAGENMMGKQTSGLMESGTYTADQLLGLHVNNLEGRYVGKIRDINLNSETGKINYITLGKSLLGMGEDTYAMVPFEALEIQYDEGRLFATLIVSEITLLAAPSHAVGESDDEFMVRLQKYYCASPEFVESIDKAKICRRTKTDVVGKTAAAHALSLF
jgi:sporulation protein YlmC with PRC-barrel domain